MVIGEARAGAAFSGLLGAGEAVRIFTGAALPIGADRCIMQEYAQREGDGVRFAEGYGPGWHVRTAASDFAAGDVLLEAGARLGARAMVAAAAADLAQVTVIRRPQVAIIATGDELAVPGAAYLHSGRVPESVSFGVAAMAEQAGARIVRQAIGRDCLPDLEKLAGAALAEADLVIVTGGASVGERDFAKTMFASHGLDLVFSKVAIKPGKPVWLGLAQGRWVLGLPGNPTSAMVTARLFLLPLLAALQGQPTRDVLRWRHLPLAGLLADNGPRETFVRAIWEDDGLSPISNQDSGAQAALAKADWLIRRPPNAPGAVAGALVSALAFEPRC
ncbi:MAG: molybdopterin molybdotransferase MoeA, partial [Sphingomonadaceae bacterium]|nr:molybdopterin molybdotransferase MoeA [Sphingomonadaceae bacterium]